MAKAIRDVYGETLKKYGAMNENIVVLDADVSGSTKSAMFGKEYPDRFYNCGISEYAMMGHPDLCTFDRCFIRCI